MLDRNAARALTIAAFRQVLFGPRRWRRIPGIPELLAHIDNIPALFIHPDFNLPEEMPIDGRGQQTNRRQLSIK